MIKIVLYHDLIVIKNTLLINFTLHRDGIYIQQCITMYMFVYRGKLLQNMANREEPDYFIMDYHPYRGGEGNQDWDSQTLVYLKMRNVYDLI